MSYGIFDPHAVPEIKPEQIFIAIDIETTGLDAGYHSICEIGWTVFTQTKILESDAGDVVCSPGQIERASPQALQTNGFTPDRLSQGLPILTVLKALEADLRHYDSKDEAIAVFQNAPFDVGFLKATHLIPHFPILDRLFRRTLDTVSLNFVIDRGKLLSLSNIAGTYLPPAEIAQWKKHSAKDDSIITARIAQTILSILDGPDGLNYD